MVQLSDSHRKPDNNKPDKFIFCSLSIEVVADSSIKLGFWSTQCPQSTQCPSGGDFLVLHVEPDFFPTGAIGLEPTGWLTQPSLTHMTMLYKALHLYVC